MQSLGSIPVAAGQLITLNTRTYTPNQVHGLALFNGTGFWLTVTALGNVQTIPPGVNDLVVLSPTVDVQFTVLAGISNHNPGVVTSEIQGNIYEIQDPLPRGYPFPNPAYVVGNTPSARIGAQTSVPAGGGGPGSLSFQVAVGATDRMLAVLIVNQPNVPFFYYVTAVGNVTGMDYTKFLTYDSSLNQNLSSTPILIPIIGGIDTSITVTVNWNATSGTSINAWCWIGPDSIFLGTNSLPLQSTDTPWKTFSLGLISNSTTTPVNILNPPSGNTAGWQVLRVIIWINFAAANPTAGNVFVQGSLGTRGYYFAATWQQMATQRIFVDEISQPYVLTDGLTLTSALTPATQAQAAAYAIPIDQFYLDNKG